MRSQPYYVNPGYSYVMHKDKYDMSAIVFVVQINGFMSLTSKFDVKYRY